MVKKPKMDELEHLMVRAGAKVTVISATVTTMRGLERDGVRWDETTDLDLVERCKGRPERLHRLRRGLSYLFGTEAAVRRWPAVFRRTNQRRMPSVDNPKTPTLEGVLPSRLHRTPAEDPVKQLFSMIFRRWVRLGGPTSVATFRVYFSFLYTFLVSTPASVIPDAHTLSRDELESRLRALTHPDLVRAYDRFRQEAQNTRRHLTLGALCMQLNIITVVFRDVLHIIKRSVVSSDFGIIKPRRQKRSAPVSTMGESTVSTQLSVFGEETLLVNDRSLEWIHDPKALKMGSAHCFNAKETRALYLACETLLEKLILTALFTTGMRIGGFCNCVRRGALLGKTIGDNLTTNEKGNRIRNYPISRGLAFLLPQWLAIGGPGPHYLFADPPGGDLPFDARKVRATFMSVAHRAGVHGVHVKPHTTRHTVCWTLSALGNKLDEIADFAGHRSTAVTQSIYIAMEEAQKRSRMNIPWLENDQQSSAERLQAIAFELAGAIAGPFASEDGKTFPEYKPRPKSRALVRVSEPMPIDESKHTAVTEASVQRAERKAMKKARKDDLRRQIIQTNEELIGILNRK